MDRLRTKTFEVANKLDLFDPDSQNLGKVLNSARIITNLFKVLKPSDFIPVFRKPTSQLWSNILEYLELADLFKV